MLEDWARVGAAERDLAAREVTLALRAARLRRRPMTSIDHRPRVESRPLVIAPFATFRTAGERELRNRSLMRTKWRRPRVTVMTVDDDGVEWGTGHRSTTPS